jgi:hypothetical protein
VFGRKLSDVLGSVSSRLACEEIQRACLYSWVAEKLLVPGRSVDSTNQERLVIYYPHLQVCIEIHCGTVWEAHLDLDLVSTYRKLR